MENTSGEGSVPRAIFIAGSSMMATRSSNSQKTLDGSMIYRRRFSLPLATSSTPDKLVQATGASPSSAQSTRMSSTRKPRSRKSLGAPQDESGSSLKPDRKRPADVDSSSLGSMPKRLRTIRTTSAGECVESDAFCWVCHTEGDANDCCCELCPRLFHTRCLGIERPKDAWVCPECEKVMKAEDIKNRSKAMSMLSIETLCSLLKFVIQRMKYPDSEPFHRPVDCALFPRYTDYVYNPMDFITLERNIKKKMYGSTEALTADVKWILHNCIVYNGKKHRLTSVARTVMKICRHETSEIEVCPDCYLNSCMKPSGDWFCEPCRVPHTLVWAKMTGYPFWPAKVLRQENGQLDVRFFGEHDRAWVPVSQAFMISEEPPTGLPTRKGFDVAAEELRKHVEKLREQFGSFTYAPNRTPFDLDNPYSKVNFSSPGIVSRSAPRSRSKFRSLRGQKRPTISVVKNTATDNSSERPPVKMILKLPPADKFTSIAADTARAVKLKYSSIASTRRASSPTKKMDGITSPADENMDDESTAIEANGDMNGSESVMEDGEESFVEQSETETSSLSKEVDEEKADSGQLLGSLVLADDGLTSLCSPKKLGIEDEFLSEKVAEDGDLLTNVPVVNQIPDNNQEMPDAHGETCLLTCTDQSTGNLPLDESSSKACCIEKVCHPQDGINDESSRTDKVNGIHSGSVLSAPSELSTVVGGDLLETSHSSVTECCQSSGISEVPGLPSDSPSQQQQLTDNGVDNEVATPTTHNDQESQEHRIRSSKECGVVNELPDCVRTITPLVKPGEVVALQVSTPTLASAVKDTVLNAECVPEISLNLSVSSIDGNIALSEVSSAKAPALNSVSHLTDSTLSVASSSMAPASLAISSLCVSDAAMLVASSAMPLSLSCVADTAQSAASSTTSSTAATTSFSRETALSTNRESSASKARAIAATLTRSLTSGSKSVEMAIDKIRRLRQQSAMPPSNLPASKVQDVVDDEKRKLGKQSAGAVIVIDDDDEDSREAMSSNLQKTRLVQIDLASDRRVETSVSSMLGVAHSQGLLAPCASGDRSVNTASAESVSRDALPLVVLDAGHAKNTPNSITDVEAQLPHNRNPISIALPPPMTSNETPFQFNVAGYDFSKYHDMIRESTAHMLEVFCHDMLNAEVGSAISKHMMLEVNRFKWQQIQELTEIRNSHALMLAEQRSLLEEEKEAALVELREQLRIEKEHEVAEAKKKQWCSQCGKEAIFYCCWNTSYCDYPCQQAHWPKHMHSCTQTTSQDNQLQPVIVPANPVAIGGNLQQSWRTSSNHSTKGSMQPISQPQRMAHISFNASATSLPNAAVQNQYGGVVTSRPWAYTSVPMQSGSQVLQGMGSAQYQHYQPIVGHQPSQQFSGSGGGIRGFIAQQNARSNMMVFRPSSSTGNVVLNQQSMSQFMVRPRQ